MANRIDLLSAATSTGPGAVATPARTSISVQAWIDAGSASVAIEGSNHPSAASAPASAAWEELAVLSLSGAGDSAAFTGVVPFVCIRANVRSITTGPVSCAMGL